jgi:hypothetical protein
MEESMRFLVNSKSRLASKSLFLSLMVLGVAINVSGAENGFGTLEIVKGDVKVMLAKDKTLVKATVGMKVLPMDQVITAADSRAKVRMSDSNILNISPNSKLVIETYQTSATGEAKKVELKVPFGKIRATVNEKYDGKSSSFNVKTPTAVAGVRGTDFMVQFDAKTNLSQIVTFTGQVEVGTKIDATGMIQNAVKVNPGQMTQMAAGEAPAAPVKISAGDLASLSKETQADASASGKDKKVDAPANEPGQKRGTASQEPESDKKEGAAPSGGKNGEGGNGRPDGAKGGPNSGPNGPGASNGMRPDAGDLYNEPKGGPNFVEGPRGPASVMMPVLMPNPTCQHCRPNFEMPTLPDDFIRGNTTKVDITIQVPSN